MIANAPGYGRSVSLPQRAEEAQDGQSARERQQQNLLEEGTPVAGAFALLLRLLSSMRQQHRAIFREVYSAPVALAAVVLDFMARRTGVAQRRMTSQAVLDFLWVLAPAFRASHSGIIQNRSGSLSPTMITFQTPLWNQMI